MSLLRRGVETIIGQITNSSDAEVARLTEELERFRDGRLISDIPLSDPYYKKRAEINEILSKKEK